MQAFDDDANGHNAYFWDVANGFLALGIICALVLGAVAYDFCRGTTGGTSRFHIGSGRETTSLFQPRSPACHLYTSGGWR
jgi:hypothetical protein